ncbi:MAG: hypothetical protein AAF549_08365 [Pseudomonadota bacterium]
MLQGLQDPNKWAEVPADLSYLPKACELAGQSLRETKGLHFIVSVASQDQLKEGQSWGVFEWHNEYVRTKEGRSHFFLALSTMSGRLLGLRSCSYKQHKQTNQHAVFLEDIERNLRLSASELPKDTVLPAFSAAVIHYASHLGVDIGCLNVLPELAEKYEALGFTKAVSSNGQIVQVYRNH